MPCQRRALHTHRELRYTGEHRQLPQRLLAAFGVTGHQAVKLLKDFLCFLFALPFHCLRHHRGRCLRDRTSCSLEGHVLDRVAFEVEINGEMVAAERIVSLGFVIGGRQLAIISRRLAVLQDHILIELAQIGHQANTSFTFWMPATKRSISARVLYRPREARAVAGILKNCMTGCAQWCPVRTAMPSRSRMVPISWG